jgi:hypothetical protein
MSMWGDSEPDLEQSVAATRRSSRTRWERPLLHASQHAPASRKATKSANRRMHGSHPRPRPVRFIILLDDRAGRALRLEGLRALPAELDRDRRSGTNRSPPPPPLDTTDLLIEGPAKLTNWGAAAHKALWPLR